VGARSRGGAPITTVATLLVRLKADTSNLIRGVGKAQLSIRGLLSIATKAAAGIGLVTAAIAGLSIKLAIDFESAFTGVRKTVDATEAQFQVLERGILDMSKRIPIAATEIAGVAEAAGQLGIAVDDILVFTEEMLKLGVATDLSAREGAIALARFSNVMGTSVEQVGNLVATIVGLGNNVAATEVEILNMATRLSKTGAIVGLTEADVLGLSAGLTELGIRAELGSTAFSRVFAEMASAAASGGKQLDRFAAVAGQSAIEFAALFKDNAVEAMVQFVEGLSQLKDADQNVFAFLDELGLGAVRVRDSLLGAALGSTGLRDAIALANAEFEVGSAANIEFQKRLDTSASRFSIFKNKIVTTGIKIGDALLPEVLRQLDALSDWLDQNEDRLAKAFVSFATAIVEALKDVIPVIRDIVTIIKTTAEFAAPVVKPVVKIGAAALGNLADPDPRSPREQAMVEQNRQFIARFEGANNELLLSMSSQAQERLAKLLSFQDSITSSVDGVEDGEQRFANVLSDLAEDITLAAAQLDAVNLLRRIREGRTLTRATTPEVDEAVTFGDFLVTERFANAENASIVLADATEQQDRLNAAFGDASDAVDRLLDALEDFAAFRMEQRVEAFFTSGAAGVAKLETEFSKLDSAWEAILPGLRALGVTVPEEWRVMFDRIQTETIDGAKRIGGGISGLLGVLIARRLMAAERFGDADPRAGLRTREALTGGGSGTVIKIEQLVIGEGAQTTTGEIATGIADGTRQALGAQAVGT